MKQVSTLRLRTKAGKRPRPLIETVSVALIKRIQQGLRKGHVWLPSERELAEEQRVSRTVLREATKRLESQGLLQIEHGRGLRVMDNLHRPLTRSISLRLPDLPTRLEQLSEVRLLLEPEIARLAALRHKLEDIATWRAIQKRLKEATTTEAAVKSDTEFHRVLVCSTGNQILRLLLDALAELSRKSRMATFGHFGTARLRSSAVQHEKIIVALERRDPDGSAGAMREHIQHVLGDLEQLTRKHLLSKERRRRGSLLDEVSEEMLKKIQKPAAKGHRLSSERDLAVELGVSRTVIREASKRLESQGLLRVERGSGLRVVDHVHHPLTRSITLRLPDLLTRLKQLSEARFLLEPEIARLAALRRKLEDLAALRAVQKGFKEARTTEEAATFDTDFHRILSRAAGNQILMLLMEALADLGWKSRLTTIARFGGGGGYTDHEKIMAALEHKDADGAAKAMREHIQKVLSEVQQLSRSQIVSHRATSLSRQECCQDAQVERP